MLRCLPLRSPQSDCLSLTDVDAWADTLCRFDANAFDPQALRTHAEHFDRPRYRDRMRDVIARDWTAHVRESSVTPPSL